MMLNGQQLPPDYEETLKVPPEVDLGYLSKPSHHGLPSPSLRASNHRLRATARFGGEPHQIEIRWNGSRGAGADKNASVATWGLHAREFATAAPDLLGLADLDASRFQPRASERLGTAKVARWWRKHPGLRLTKRLSVLDTLIPIILAQRILGKEAKHIHQRLFARAATQPPGPPGLLVPPSPEALRNIGYETWHLMGLERSRARLIHQCAANAERIESWRDLDTEHFYNNLTSIPRIGPWTANRVLYAFGHADAVWIGDYNLPSFVSWNLAKEPRADDARMLELLEPYRDHRARVLRLMEFEGTTPPRFGPRLALRNIQHH